jgi:hypothetical protein
MKLLRALAVCLALGVACTASDQGIEVTIPRDLVGATAWFEVGAFKDARCAVLDPLLASGLPEGPTARVAFRKSDGVGPRFGDLPKGRYAFAGVARDRTCAVVAKGCVEQDAASGAQVSVQLRALDEPTGACAAGATCQAGQCLPANDNADPSVGAGCSLELLGAGPLITSQGEGSNMSAPAIAPSDYGFVISYREHVAGGDAVAYVLPLDTSGGIYGVGQDDPDGVHLRACNRNDETDGVAMVTGGKQGLVAVANDCDGAPSFSLFGFDVSQQFLDKNQTKQLLAVTPSTREISTAVAGGTPVTLGAARAAARRANDSVIVYTEGGVGRVGTMDPARGVVVANGTFGGANVTDSLVAASEQVLALVAVGKASAVPDDAGDGGSGGGGVTSDTAAQLYLLPPDASLDAITRTPIQITGATWASVAALGGRVFVLSDAGRGAGRSASFRAFNITDPTRPDVGGFTMDVDDPDATAKAGDVAIRGDRAYFAVLRPRAIELHVYGNIANNPIPLRSVAFKDETRISAINTVGDGRVAVAVTDSRVGVVWTTKRTLEPNDPAGGYAVFACTR